MKTPVKLADSVRMFKSGNKEEFTNVYQESYKYLHTCAIHIIKNEEEVQDMLQEAYVDIYKNISQLNEPENFLSWAATITNHRCFAYLKKNKEILVTEQADDEGNETDFFDSLADDDAFIPENILDNKEKILMIRGIIDSLTDLQRACVIGFYYNEQKQDEIANELGIPVNTVKSHLNRAKAKIKEAVGDVEKKQGVKLYSIAPFMLMLFSKEIQAYAEGTAVPAMGAALSGLAVAKTAAGTGSAAATASSAKAVSSAGLKAAGMTVKTKVTAGILAGAVVAGGVTGAVLYGNNQEAPEPEISNYADVYIDRSDILEEISVYGIELDEVSYEDIIGRMEDVESEYESLAEPEYYIGDSTTNYQAEYYDGPAPGINYSYGTVWRTEDMDLHKHEYRYGHEWGDGHVSEYELSYMLEGETIDETWIPLYDNCRYYKNLKYEDKQYDGLVIEDSEGQLDWKIYSDGEEIISIVDMRDKNEALKKRTDGGLDVIANEDYIKFNMGISLADYINGIYPELYDMASENEEVEFQNGNLKLNSFEYEERSLGDDKLLHGEKKKGTGITVKFSDPDKARFSSISFGAGEDGLIRSMTLRGMADSSLSQVDIQESSQNIEVTEDNAVSDEEYEHRKADVLATIEEARHEHNRDKAYLAAYQAAEDYPEDDFFASLKQELLDQAPDSVAEDDVIDKKACNVESYSFDNLNGEHKNADFSINLGGGSITLRLDGRYEYLELDAILSEQSPTKALVDIDIYGDDKLLYSTKDFSVDEVEVNAGTDISGVNVLRIESADHHHYWVGEASFNKPDKDCHFNIRLYEERDLEWIDK